MRLSACSAALVLLFSSNVFAQAPAETPAPPVNAPPVIAAPPAAPPPAAPAATVAAPAPAAAPAAPAAPAPPPWYSILRFEALVDSYYQYNFTGSTTDPNQPLNTVRNFDITSNSFSLNFAKVAAQLDVSPITLRIDLGYGHTGAVINSLSKGASGLTAMGAGAGASLYGSAFIVEQAFSTLALGPLSIDFGKFVTTAGAEVNEANKNWLYSRSLLFFTIPILHTGARANYKVNDMVSLQASVVNGINNDPDNNGWKTVGLSATVTPISTTSVIVTDYFGKEGAQGATTEGDVKNTLDVVVSQTLSDKLSLNLNVDYIKLDSAYTVGGALMGHYVLSDALNFSARAEYVKDKALSFSSSLDGYYYEGTLSAAAPFAGHLEVRAEVRADFCKSGQKVFVGAKDDEVTGTVAFISYL